MASRTSLICCVGRSGRVLSARRRSTRSAPTRSPGRWHVKAGGTAWMVTSTARHRSCQSLAPMLDAVAQGFKPLMSGRAAVAEKADLGVCGCDPLPGDHLWGERVGSVSALRPAPARHTEALSAGSRDRPLAAGLGAVPSPMVGLSRPVSVVCAGRRSHALKRPAGTSRRFGTVTILVWRWGPAVTGRKAGSGASTLSSCWSTSRRPATWTPLTVAGVRTATLGRKAITWSRAPTSRSPRRRSAVSRCARSRLTTGV
jgi:hypothetical protein